jgi:ABC-type nitrate/sulfonate/bicarbonate transport system substrate-binding protein
MKIAVPDLISNSHFPALAAAELGFFAKEGLDATIESVHPASKTFEALRDGAVDFVAGPAHGMLFAFPEWRGGKLVAALAQGTFWMLVMRSDLNAQRGDLSVVHGKRIAAVPVVELGLRLLLEEAGIDLIKAGVQIVSVPGSGLPGFAAGVAAAKALSEGKIDGFWANATGAEMAVRNGVGTIVLDVRRGDGPPAAFHYTMPSFATTDHMVERNPNIVRAALRAIVAVQQALKRNPQLAAKVGHKLFPPEEASLIADVVERDLPYYDATITEAAVAGLNNFARRAGLLKGDASYESVVATQFRHLWAALRSTRPDEPNQCRR